MSMNLHCEGIDLWQTPTYITEMCLSINPHTREPDGGMAGVRRRYAFWVRDYTSGVWHSDAEYQAMKNAVQDHLSELYSIADPKFFSM
jgi:hypothetical protein